MKITYKSSNYAAAEVVRRYARRIGVGSYRYCETNGRLLDVLQANLAADEIPEAIRDEVEAQRDFYFGWVLWPADVSPPAAT